MAGTRSQVYYACLKFTKVNLGAKYELILFYNSWCFLVVIVVVVVVVIDVVQ